MGGFTAKEIEELKKYFQSRRGRQAEAKAAEEFKKKHHKTASSMFGDAAIIAAKNFAATMKGKPPKDPKKLQLWNEKIHSIKAVQARIKSLDEQMTRFHHEEAIPRAPSFKDPDYEQAFGKYQQSIEEYERNFLSIVDRVRSTDEGSVAPRR